MHQYVGVMVFKTLSTVGLKPLHFSFHSDSKHNIYDPN